MFDRNGIWCGKDSTIAIIDDYYIAFLRIKNECIASILKHHKYETIGVVYGMGINFDAYAMYCGKNPETEQFFYNTPEAKEKLQHHSNDKIEYDTTNQKLLYTMYDGKVFELILAEQIHMDDFKRINPPDPHMPLAKKMALWGINKFFEYRDEAFSVGIDTQRYSIYFHFSAKDKNVYCRVGQNGYCEKGWAMLSTTCIRYNECRMIENNLLTLNAYRPIEECFVSNSCAFPPDGGWYWSVKEVTEDVIYLHGCQDSIYEIHRL